MHSRATDRRSASKCQGKWADQTLDQAFGLPEVLVAVSTSRLSCKRARKTRTLMPVWDSSGESQLNARYRKVRYHSASRCHPRRRCVRVNGGKNDSRQNAVARTTTEVQRRAPSTKSLNSATRLTKTSTTVIRSIEASWGWVKGDAGRRYGKQIFKIRPDFRATRWSPQRRCLRWQLRRPRSKRALAHEDITLVTYLG